MIITNKFVAIDTRNKIHGFYKYGRGAEVCQNKYQYFRF